MGDVHVENARQGHGMGEGPAVQNSNANNTDFVVQACSHWLGWSGFNLTTFIQFIQH